MNTGRKPGSTNGRRAEVSPRCGFDDGDTTFLGLAPQASGWRYFAATKSKSTEPKPGATSMGA